ncbi:MAG: N-acetyltransferase [Desulfobacterales bacterium]|nr:N-acetyltransferase [Desulfobacterales bacterium]
MTAQKSQTHVRVASPDDAEAIAAIYNHYITQTIITFEEEAVSAADIRQRMEEVQASSLPWWVAEHGGQIAGYAYASKWKGRCAYRFSTEVSIYINPVHVRQGIGTEIYSRLLPTLKHIGIHVAIGGIALPNEASIALHEKFGFVKVAHFKEVGFKFNRWIDVGYWQRKL